MVTFVGKGTATGTSVGGGWKTGTSTTTTSSKPSAAATIPTGAKPSQTSNEPTFVPPTATTTDQALETAKQTGVGVVSVDTQAGINRQYVAQQYEAQTGQSSLGLSTSQMLNKMGNVMRNDTLPFYPDYSQFDIRKAPGGSTTNVPHPYEAGALIYSGFTGRQVAPIRPDQWQKPIQEEEQQPTYEAGQNVLIEYKPTGLAGLHFKVQKFAYGTGNPLETPTYLKKIAAYPVLTGISLLSIGESLLPWNLPKTVESQITLAKRIITEPYKAGEELRTAIITSPEEVSADITAMIIAGKAAGKVAGTTTKYLSERAIKMETMKTYIPETLYKKVLLDELPVKEPTGQLVKVGKSTVNILEKEALVFTSEKAIELEKAVPNAPEYMTESLLAGKADWAVLERESIKSVATGKSIGEEVTTISFVKSAEKGRGITTDIEGNMIKIAEQELKGKVIKRYTITGEEYPTIKVETGKLGKVRLKVAGISKITDKGAITLLEMKSLASEYKNPGYAIGRGGLAKIESEFIPLENEAVAMRSITSAKWTQKELLVQHKPMWETEITKSKALLGFGKPIYETTKGVIKAFGRKYGIPRKKITEFTYPAEKFTSIKVGERLATERQTRFTQVKPDWTFEYGAGYQYGKAAGIAKPLEITGMGTGDIRGYAYDMVSLSKITKKSPFKAREGLPLAELTPKEPPYIPPEKSFEESGRQVLKQLSTEQKTKLIKSQISETQKQALERAVLDIPKPRIIEQVKVTKQIIEPKTFMLPTTKQTQEVLFKKLILPKTTQQPKYVQTDKLATIQITDIIQEPKIIQQPKYILETKQVQIKETIPLVPTPITPPYSPPPYVPPPIIQTFKIPSFEGGYIKKAVPRGRSRSRAYIPDITSIAGKIKGKGSRKLAAMKTYTGIELRRLLK